MNKNTIKNGITFLKKLKNKHFGDSPTKNDNTDNQNTVSIIQSDALGITIIQNEDQFDRKDQIEVLSPEEWVMILENGSLKGFSFSRIYFSILKGIPNYLRLKLWLFLCSQNNSKNFKLSVKNLPSNLINGENIQKNNGQFVEIKQFTTQIYLKLSSYEPLQKQIIQIQKDVHRTYSNRKEYQYTDKMLRKILIALSNSGIEYSQGMNYILLNIIIYCLESLGLTNEEYFKAVTPSVQKDIFIIMRQIVIRMDTVFGNNNIFKVVQQLQQKIAQSVPEVLFLIYKLGMDCFSMFSQYYFSLLSYNNPPDELCKQMLDLFFLVGEKAIHAIIVRMLEVSKQKILKIQSPEQLQQLLKVGLFEDYYQIFLKEKQTAKNLSDFGLSFYQNS